MIEVPNMSTIQLKIENLTVKYHTFAALANITFNVHKKDFIAVIGANGSGKTTLVKTILGLLNSSEGKIVRDKNTRIGYLPQHLMTLDRFFPATVEEVVGMGLLANKPFPKRLNKANRNQIDDTLQMLNIKNLKSKRIGSLSGGQQQRVLLARALVSNPGILILDEPTSALDYKIRKQFFEILEHLNKVHDVTIILVTHDIVSAGDYINRVIYLDQKVLFDGPFNEFCENDELSPFIHTHKVHHQKGEDV